MNQKGEVPMSVLKAIKRFEKAVQEQSWAGSQPPETRPEIERERASAHANLVAKIKKAIIDDRMKPAASYSRS